MSGHESSGENQNAKRSTPETRSTHKRRVTRSPLLTRRAGDGSGSASGRGRSGTSDGAVSEGHLSQDEADMVCEAGSYSMLATNGGSSDVDDVDSADKKRPAMERVRTKIQRQMELIKAEQLEKEENVNEYLRLSANADRQQQLRIKTVFEKRNQKSTTSISQLQRKLEAYQKQLKELELYGVQHRKAKDVLQDMGYGLKGVGAKIGEGITGFSGGVVDNIKGAKETIVSKPKEFASRLLKNKFGSADNISNNTTWHLEETGSETDERTGGEKQVSTLPAGFKYPGSDDETSSVSSVSGAPSGAGTHSSPRPFGSTGGNTAPAPIPLTTTPSGGHPASSPPVLPNIDLEPIFTELQERCRHELETEIELLRTKWETQLSFIQQNIDSECERLEEQLNDLTELHQHEVTNMKQELSSIEEKMEYQLEERTRDMQELLETCQTRITKMELQQQQQQIISMEGIENSNFRALITKMINVVLALLAVILVFVSTCANLLGPFLTTRIRVLTTICLIASIIVVAKNWLFLTDYTHQVLDQYRHLLPSWV